MAYTSVPTLADGAVLTASHMNILANNVNDLIARGEQPNVSFETWGTGTAGSKTWYMRRKHRYLKMYYTTQTGCDYVKLKVNGTTYVNADPPALSATVGVDLNTTGVAVGDWYEINVETAFVGAASLTVWLIWERTWA